MRVGLLHSVLRTEEKMLMSAFADFPEVELVRMDDRELQIDPCGKPPNVDVVLARSVGHSRRLNAVRLFEQAGIPCLNNARVTEVCGDKLLTSQALIRAGIPHPELRIAFTEKAALQAIEEMGYPVVLKPVVGSWGRLICKINDRDAAEAVLEHKATLGHYQHSIFYIQRFVEKRNGDIRSFVIDDTCIAAIRRTSAYWKTNTALGAVAANCPVDRQLRDLSVEAARAVGGGILAVDLFETEDGLLVNEVNDSMEFRNSVSVTGVDIPGLIACRAVGVARESSTHA